MRRAGVSLVIFLGGIFFLFGSGIALAVNFVPASNPNLQDMLKHLSQDVPNLMRLVTSIGFVMGFFFIIKGLMEMRHFGESRTMMSQEHGITKPLAYIFVGAMLLYLPGIVHVGLGTLWGVPVNPYAWQTQSSGSASSVSDAVFMIVQLIGTISFIRGLVILTQLGGGHHQGGFAKALAHIVAGILCINLYGFLQVMSSSLGIGQWSP